MIALDRRRRMSEIFDRADVHEVGSDEPGEREQACLGQLRPVSDPEDEESDQRDGDLRLDCVLAGAEKALDLEVLLDPAEEQLDLPASLVELGDALGRRLEIVGEEPQCAAGVDDDGDLAQGVMLLSG